MRFLNGILTLAVAAGLFGMGIGCTSGLNLGGNSASSDGGSTSANDGGSSSSPGDGSAAATGPWTAHPSCPASGTSFSSEIGTTCATGSNQPVCAASSTECVETNLCVWDENDAKGVKAYCTIACDPSSASSCPTDFTCTAQDCTTLGPANVCLRTSAAVATPTCSTIVSTGDPNAGIEAADGYDYVAVTPSENSALNFYAQKKDSGTWTSLGVVGVTPGGFGVRFAQLGPDAYAFAGGSVVHFSNGAADVEQVADDTSNFDGVASVFLTPEGALRFEGSGYLMERDSSGNWNTLTPSTTRYDVVASMQNHGMLVVATNPATSKTGLATTEHGDDITYITSPPGAGSENWAAGFSPTDFMLLTTDGTGGWLGHFDGTTWVADPAAPIEYEAQGPLFLTPNGYEVDISGASVGRLDVAKSCWELAGTIPSTGDSAALLYPTSSGAAYVYSDPTSGAMSCIAPTN